MQIWWIEAQHKRNARAPPSARLLAPTIPSCVLINYHRFLISRLNFHPVSYHLETIVMRISFIYFVVFFIVKVLFLIFIEKIIYFWSILINKPTKIQIEVCLGFFSLFVLYRLKICFITKFVFVFAILTLKKGVFWKNAPPHEINCICNYKTRCNINTLLYWFINGELIYFFSMRVQANWMEFIFSNCIKQNRENDNMDEN